MGKERQSGPGRNEFRFFKVPGSPYLQVRLTAGGKRRQFSTGEKIEKAATAKARAIMSDFQSLGYNEALALHSKKDDVVDRNPTIEELVNLYTKAARTFESPPGASSIRVYTNNLKLIASYLQSPATRDPEQNMGAGIPVKGRWPERACPRGGSPR